MDIKEKIKEFNKTKTLENGETVRYIVLIFDTEKEAKQIRKKADELGIYNTCYEIDGLYMILDPIGNWRTDL